MTARKQVGWGGVGVDTLFLPPTSRDQTISSRWQSMLLFEQISFVGLSTVFVLFVGGGDCALIKCL